MNRLFVLSLCVLLAACTPEPVPVPSADRETPEAQAAEPQRVSIMAFNVENLFDTEDDPGKDDATYLPASVKADPAHVAGCALIEVDRWREDCLYLDWSEDALRFKLEQLAATILAYNDGIGPDILALQEVENIAVLDRLRLEHLQPAGYRAPVLIEGPDDRGIDVAFLTRLPLVGDPVLHPVDMSAFPDGAQDTRGILEANFELPDGTILTGYSVHFPAPYHPIEMRQIAYAHLNRVRSGLPEDRPAFAAGDFNTPRREKEETSIMDDMVRPYWTVAHEVGCRDCKGTNYWASGKTWSFLDMLLFSPASAGGWVLDVDSVDVVTGYPDQLHPDGAPKRFNLDAREGVSDHLPIVMSLERRP